LNFKSQGRIENQTTTMLNKFLPFFCILLTTFQAHGQTVEGVRAVLDGHVFTRTFVIDDVPAEEEWLGPTFMELIVHDNSIIMETPNISSVEYTSATEAWQVFEKNDSTILVFGGMSEIAMVVDLISDTQISGRFLGKSLGRRDSAAPEPEVRINMDRVYQGIQSREQLLIGVWKIEGTEDSTKQPMFTDISIDDNGEYTMTGGLSEETGTWMLSPSGRYFIISKAGADDLIFRVDRLTEDELELRQGHYYSVIDLKFTRNR